DVLAADAVTPRNAIERDHPRFPLAKGELTSTRCAAQRFRASIARLPYDQPLDMVLEHRQRYRTELEHRVVELADVELRAELFFRERAQLRHFQLAELVAQRLRRP